MADMLREVGGFLRQHKYIIIGGLVVTGSAGYVAFRTLSRRAEARNVKKERVCGVDYPKDTVIVHCPKSEGKFVPSDGVFVMKLETYLRVAKIPYEPCFDLDLQYAPKGKIPWIEYNGVTMGDSQLIINYLNKEFNVDLHKTLTAYHRAIAWCVQKWLEEYMYWLNSYTRWVIFHDDYHSGKYMSDFYSQKHVKTFIKDLMTKMTHAQGVGRHSNEEVFEMMEFDLRQLSFILGSNSYLTGARITEVDCAAFGLLCQIRYQTPDKCPGKQLLNDSRELKNLRDYIDRIKYQYWPDWESRLLKD